MQCPGRVQNTGLCRGPLHPLVLTFLLLPLPRCSRAFRGWRQALCPGLNSLSLIIYIQYVKIKISLFLFIRVHVRVCRFTDGYNARGSQRKTSDPLELNLQAVASCLMWILKTKLCSFGRAVCTQSPRYHASLTCSVF